MKYIDIHGHINFSDYDLDREEVFQRAADAEVGMIIVGTDLESSQQAIKLAEKYENVWAAVGMHPVEAGSQPVLTSAEMGKFKHQLLELAQHPKVVALGECGLDYFHSKPEEIVEQKRVFIDHILVANQLNKPLMLHVRNVKNNTAAYQEAVELLKQYSKVRANFHFFAGTLDDAKSILEINGTMSFTGVLTFTQDYDELVKYIPIGNIMSETDCPFVSPVPYRGKRNEPSYVIEVAKRISDIKGENLSVTCEKLVENAKNFFSL